MKYPIEIKLGRIHLKMSRIFLVTWSPSDGIPREIRLLEVVLDEAVGLSSFSSI